MGINLHNVTYRYDQRKTDGIQDLSFEIPSQKITALIGPSGSGKTTTLRCLASYLLPKKGEIIYPGEFKISYVDQTPKFEDESESIFLHLSQVLREEIPTEEKRANQIRSTLGLLSLTNEIESPIASLSGGQRQRFIIAKALITNPTLLLLDEPFANLDRNLRWELLDELFDIFKEQEVTVVWVTHNTEEALAFSDQLALLNYGSLQQVGTPKELYYQPDNLFCAQFFTQTNLLPGKLIAEENKELVVHFLGEDFIIPKPHKFSSPNKEVLIIALPEHIEITDDGRYQGKVIKRIFLGSKTLVEFSYQDKTLFAEIATIHALKGDTIQFEIMADNLFCLGEV